MKYKEMTFSVIIITYVYSCNVFWTSGWLLAWLLLCSLLRLWCVIHPGSETDFLKLYKKARYISSETLEHIKVSFSFRNKNCDQLWILWEKQKGEMVVQDFSFCVTNQTGDCDCGVAVVRLGEDCGGEGGGCHFHLRQVPTSRRRTAQ